MSPRTSVALIAATLLAAGLVSPARGQDVQPPFNATYSVVDLGAPPGVPSPLGGCVISPDNPGVLLIGGAANSGSAAIYAVNLVRNTDGEITGFSGTPTLVSTAPGIDGGLFFGPGGVLCFTTYSDNRFGQILQGSTSPDLFTNLTGLGVAASTGTANFIPPQFPGGGSIIIGSYSAGIWYTATPVPTGTGTFTLSGVTARSNTGGGPEGIVYPSTDSPQFGVPSAVVTEYSAGRVRAYEVDGFGAPIPSTGRDFITGLSGAEGACLDPITGQFVFSTFGGGDRVIVIRGFSRAAQCNAADIAQSDGNPGPDGDINNGDFQLFFQSFFVGCSNPGSIPCGLADIAGPGGLTNPDGQIDNGDFQLFFSLFFQGCPA